VELVQGLPGVGGGGGGGGVKSRIDAAMLGWQRSTHEGSCVAPNDSFEFYLRANCRAAACTNRHTLVQHCRGQRRGWLSCRMHWQPCEVKLRQHFGGKSVCATMSELQVLASQEVQRSHAAVLRRAVSNRLHQQH